MINRNGNGQPTTLFWNCVGIAIAFLSVGMSWSVAQTSAFELELAQYKLRTGTALYQVQKASDTLKTTTKELPIKPQKKQQIVKQLDRSNQVIEQAIDQVENLE